MKSRPTFITVAVCCVAALLASCSEFAISPNGSEPGGPDQGDNLVSLTALQSEEAFYAALRSALVESTAGVDNESAVSEGIQDDVASGGLPGSDDVSDSSDSTSNDVTGTNVQEVGVDEQDRVKVNAAGTKLYVLHTRDAYYDHPSTDEGESDSADESIANDTASEEPDTVLRILSLDAQTPDATALNELDIDLDGLASDGFYLYESDTETSVIVTATGTSYWNWNESTSFSSTSGLIAKYDVEDVSNAQMTASFTIDGQIVSSRRIGHVLFFASRFYPQLPGFETWEQGSEEWLEALDAADLSKLLPEYYSNEDAQSAPLVSASECFIAPLGSDQRYRTPDIITLGVIDLSTMELRDSECFLGATETLYANTESVFLATTQFDYSDTPSDLFVDGSGDSLIVDSGFIDPRSSTEIHQFDIAGDQIDYRGSGSVRGHLGWNPQIKPFRLSERDGYLRVATVNDNRDRGVSPILLHILQADDSGELKLVSTLPNEQRPQYIGEPGEQLYASRFLGDKAYIVTFLQTDPLYVIDLANPEDPEIKGELKIDGYSDYLHPLDEGLLLGIGKDAIALPDDIFADGRGAWVQGIKLALFDVSDPTNPTEIRSLVVGERGTDSVALRNHRAITIQSATELHPARLSFSIDVHGEPEPLSPPSLGEVSAWNEYNYTGLHGFDILVGANADIVPVGSLIVQRASGVNSRFFNPTFGDERSVMVNDAVYYIHGRQVYPALWENLSFNTQAR